MSGNIWVVGDVITAARMNHKTVLVAAAEPAVMYAGMLWYDTATDLLKERNAANAAWRVIGPAKQGAIASRPAFGNAGLLYYATDTSDLWYDAGAAWEQWLASVALKAGDYPTAYVGISAAATGRAANLDAAISSRAPESGGNVAAIKAKTDLIAGTTLVAADIAVPTADSTADVSVRDVVGRKTDAAQTAVGTTRSLMGYLKGILNQIATLITMGTKPAADSTNNVYPADVIGAKDDAVQQTVAANRSLMAYVKALLTNMTSTRAGYLDAAITTRLASASYVTERGTDGAALASSWTAGLATALGSYTAARAAYLDNVNQAGLLQLTAARAALLDQITAARLTELDAANIPADLDVVKADTPYLADAALPGTPTAGSIGALVKTNLNATISSRQVAATTYYYTGALADGASYKPAAGTVVHIAHIVFTVPMTGQWYLSEDATGQTLIDAYIQKVHELYRTIQGPIYCDGSNLRFTNVTGGSRTIMLYGYKLI